MSKQSACTTYVWQGNTDLDLSKWPLTVPVKQIALGLHHTAFLTSDGEVLCCGLNSHGQLGIGNNTGTYADPIVVPFLEDEEVTSVAVGLHHTVCGTKSGRVYCWGDSTHSQCASLESAQYTTPTCVATFNSPVKKVDCCAMASVALLSDGRLFAWGTGPVFQGSHSKKHQVIEPSPFSFIEDRFVLDVSCGTNFIVAVLEKTTPTLKKLITKNNYVVVHKSDIEPNTISKKSHSRAPSEGSLQLCPLGLELAEEHVYLPMSAQSSPSSVRRFGAKAMRSSSVKSSSGSKHSNTSSVESLTVSQTCGQQAGGDSNEILDKSRSMSSLSQPHVINVDQNEAEQWLKDRIGSSFPIKAGEIPSVSENEPFPDVSTSSSESTSVSTGTKVREKLPQYMGSMWNSITSSSHAVSSAVQTHIVSKIPLLDKLKVQDTNSSAPTDNKGLTPIVLPNQVAESAHDDPRCNVESGEDNHPTSLYRAVTSRALRHTESSSSLSSAPHSRNISRSGSATNIAIPQREFDSPACISTEVWSWGLGDHGQLGHGDCLDRPHPCMISSLSDSQIYKVRCSHHSTLVLTTDGTVYGWGDNTHNQLLYKLGPMVLHPASLPISLKLPVVDLSLGSDHALLEVVSPVNGVARGGIFCTGPTTDSELGTRLMFTRSLGRRLCMDAGPNGISSICAQGGVDDMYRELRELIVSEIQLYRGLLNIQSELVNPIIESDYMTALLESPMGTGLQSTVESLFSLIDKIGVNTQELSAVRDPIDLVNVSLVGNCQAYMKYFLAYATHFHNLLSINGLTQLVDKVRPVLLRNIESINSLLERCQLEFSDELLVKVSVLLQLPLRRVSEYHDVIERIQLRLEDGSMLVPCLTYLEKEKLHLSSQYHSAESTRIFWEKWPKAITASLKEPHRRLVRESKTLSLALVGGSKLYKNNFALFNDVFVHVQGQIHKVYPLEKLWIEAGTSDGTHHEHEIKLIMPEATLTVLASNTAEKAEWMWILSQTVSLWLSSYKLGASDQHPVNHRGTMLKTTPASRVATHMFYKAGQLQGAVYRGKWLKGKMHGEGQITWADGKVYSGQFYEGEIKGYGKMTTKIDGKTETMEGHWNNGKLHGFAKARYANGDTYTGFYKDHQFHGHGILKQKSTSSVYIGEWKDGRRYGYGVLDKKGEKYLGQWSKDVKQGPGLQITLDGCYMEGTFQNNKLIGQGIIMTSDDTYYEGNFTGINEVNGKGTMVLSSGDSITGTFDGSWADGIKVSGTFCKAAPSEDSPPFGSMISTSPRLPKSFGHLSTSHDLKWIELFQHSQVALGCSNTDSSTGSDCEKAWEKVAILFASLRNRNAPHMKRRLYSEQLEKIPPHNLTVLSLEHYRSIRKYLAKACDCDLHPLGLLLSNLVDVYRTSYSGTGTHPRLLPHAREELLSITHRYYDIIRILFPELPAEHSPKKILAESALSAPTNSSAAGDYQSSSATSDHMTSNNDLQLEDRPRTVIVEQPIMEESEVITPTLLIFPLLMSKIYEPLFHLYALQNEAADEQYWWRIQKFNKQCDLTLLAYLGIPEKFWILNDGNSLDSDPKSLDVKDGCYIEAIEILQRMSTCLTPAEKLQSVQLTFDKINTLVKEHLTDKFVWSMDDLFPVFLFVVIRSRLRYLGSEIQLMDDLMDSHLEYGELGLMFTTLKACHLQIQTEKLL